MNVNYLLDNLKKNKDRLAIVSDDREYSFDDIYNEYEKAVMLLQKKSISPGSVVSVIAEFTPVSIALLIALIERDMIIVPISRTIKEKDRYIRISESQYVIDLWQNINISRTNTEVKHKMLRTLIRKQAPGLILFSSGTTGEPKAALHDLTFLMKKFEKPGKCLSTVTFLLFDHMILLSRIYEKYNLSSLKMISYGTEPMPESTLKQLHKLLPEIKLKQTYGLSELGIMSTKSMSSDSLWMKVGGDGYETKIVDDILYIRARSAMIGYLNASSPFDEDGWFNTKDKVEKNGDYIKILGRTTDLINVGGEKVYPNEVESVLLSFDGVRDVYVYGEANPITGQSVIANVCVDKNNDNRDFIKQLRKYCKDNLESYKRPTSYRLTTEVFYGERFKKKR